MKYKLMLILPALCTAVGAYSAEITATTAQGRTVTVTAITDNIVRVDNLAPGEKAHDSRAVVLNPEKVNAKVTTQGAHTSMITPGGVVATINNTDGSLTITSGPRTTVTDLGLRTIADDRRELTLYTPGGGSFYGAGERGYTFNLAGDTLVMYNKQNYGYTASEPRIKQMGITMPLFISPEGYAVLIDDYAAAEMIMTDPIRYITESPDPVTWYYISGSGSLEGVTSRLSALTGRQELPPFWALGYITSKYGYKTEAEATGVIDTLKTQGYPVDGIVLDLYWYGKEQDMGRLAWDPEQWPTHQKMLKDLADKGVNLIPISQPYVLRNGRGLDNYNALAPQGMFVMDQTGTKPQEVTIWVGSGGMFDVSNPDTRRWLSDRYRDLTLEGVAGWWGDLGEPEVHPETGRHANGLTARQYHNQYGNDWSEIIYDLFKTEWPERRLMTMMRGGTTGLQRYSVYPWSTDVSRTWGGLQPQITIMLNSGLSGMGYMSHDVGGFAIMDPENVTDPELYVRWLQLGTFSPILRTHAQQVAEPYKYTEHQNIILPLIRERYRWLPYNYTLAWENAANGQPLVRPLNYYTPGQSALDTVTDQYLWGRDVMVAPVLQQGATERTVVFPDGLWYDMAAPARLYHGGETITYAAPLEVLPLFVRAGAFIPLANGEMQNTRDYNPADLTVRYYPAAGVDSQYTMYDDDRTSATALARGNYQTIDFAGSDTGASINITATVQGTYPGAPSQRHIDFAICGMPKAPAAATVVTGAGKPVAVDVAKSYNAASQTLTVPAALGAEPVTIVVTR